MIITISGAPGSGKSDVSRRLAERLGYLRVSMGDLFRSMAKERGLSADGFYRSLGDDPEFERAVDERMAQRVRGAEHLIAEGRVTFLWVPPGTPSLKVFLSVDPSEGARRIASARKMGRRVADEEAITIADVAVDTARRVALERERYRSLYGIDDHHNPRNFDLVVDTTLKTQDEVVQEILAHLPA